MQLDEFTFLYQDMKEELKEIPSLPILLKSAEKTTKKLECINLYSLTDRRDFDFQIYEKEIFDEMSSLVKDLNKIKEDMDQDKAAFQDVSQYAKKIQSIKQSKITIFDQLDKQEEQLSAEIAQLVNQKALIGQSINQNEIKQVEEDDEPMDGLPESSEETVGFGLNRAEELKKQIETINNKIAKINRGKGKWFDGDHNDFVKIYNRSNGDAKKILNEGLKMLGMKNTEILDHLEVFQAYLQLEKQKKLANEEYRSIKFLQKQEENDKKTQAKLLEEQKLKRKQLQKLEEQIKKKEQIHEYKRKKIQMEKKLLEEEEKQKQQKLKIKKIPIQKAKEIQQRNKKFIEKRQEQFKIQARSNSNQKSLVQVSKEKGKKTVSQINPIPTIKNAPPKIPLGKVTSSKKQIIN